MTDNTVKVICENGGGTIFVNMGTSLAQVADMLSLNAEKPNLAAYVNNTVRDLNYLIYSPVSIRFIDINHFEGIRVYQRTLFFILQKACYDLFPDRKLFIKHSVAKGFYGEFGGMDSIPDDEVRRIKERMQAIINQDIPIVRQKILATEAEEIYKRFGQEDKLVLMETRPSLYVTLYHLANMAGYFYGSLCVSTRFIHLFDLQKYYKGFYVAVPRRTAPSQLEPMIPQDKMFDIFSEYTRWVDIIGVSNIGALNSVILSKKGGDLIKIAEAFHENKLSSIADRIKRRHDEGGGRVVLISGPSSSGKTTFARKLGIQLRILGLHPVLISLDDYFVDRERTPRDEKGEYDYEALEAIDADIFNNDLGKLLAGERADIPRYNFITGRREYGSNLLQLDPQSVILVEGIHGLNPKLTAHIDDKEKFRIYVSALTSISIDNLNRIPTTDNRLIRRIVRDYHNRGNNAMQTLRRWESVRRGEDLHIFPNQEQADVMFNSSLFYELAVLKYHVEPLLHEVPNTEPEYGEARRLLKFLDQFTPLPGDEIPPTSILREFIGGSSFSY